MQLISKGFISLKDALHTMRRVNDDGSEIHLYSTGVPATGCNDETCATSQDYEDEEVEPTEVVNDTAQDNRWSDEETKYLLDQYQINLNNIGPKKKFKNKKALWNFLSCLLTKKFNINRSATQVESRYKTVLRRKKRAVDNNNRSGRSYIGVPFQEELDKICRQDDSIIPNILRSEQQVEFQKEDSSNEQYTPQSSSIDDVLPASPASASDRATPSLMSKKRKQSTSSKDILTFLKEKETNKERRHQEKLQILQETKDLLRELIALKKDK
ncbi:uncharacterized protein LOC116176441 [Photinus pyralis]|uniref:uncharacterized protein LOC116176441 n=1 Tax=Photinus pyralis TaxID=7054 RepID=UPI0012672FBD|nr:uncharacterized protein LOC116176441 [Photinus pyralis]